MIIRIEHIREADLCLSGARQWFRAYKLDWRDFLANGIDEEKVIAIGDPLALRVIEIARRGAE